MEERTTIMNKSYFKKQLRAKGVSLVQTQDGSLKRLGQAKKIDLVNALK